MPDLVAESTLPPPELNHVLRQSFLWRIDTPEHSDAMARFGDLLFTFINEGGMWGPREDRRPLSFREAESAAAELDAIAVYLEDIADAPNQSELEPREYPLCLAAVAWARQTRETAGTIRRTLGASVGDEPEPVPASALGPEEATAALRLLEKLRAALEEARNLQRLDRDGVLGRSVGNLAESVTVLEAAIKGATE